ncbi:ATP-binding protein [Metabacillus sp. GX 13764]|uniref:MHYT domain-containing protein n=1 Tax=Metabacillus kandeliae TaxID=2900151 RepID=UPI001E62F7B1|nr:MHYT domain-containing protein [Metabacillus kandeliae]MCD7036195.1 ATP-binding protein [Metabacillus kandeliae]
MKGDYIEVLVIFSIIIAIFGSYTAMDLAEKAIKESKYKLFWSSAAGLSLGIGIWTMHFIGMIGYQVPFTIQFDPGKTFLSLVIAVAASLIGFVFMTAKKVSFYWDMVSGIIVGAGISGMHYLGMSAMKMPVHMAYNMPLVFLSILIAIGCAFLAAYMMRRRRNNEQLSIFSKLISSVILGLGISGMHYTGMAAMTYEAHMHEMSGAGSGSQDQYTILAVAVGMMTLFIFMIFLGGNAKSRMAEHDKMQRKERRYQYLLENTPNLVVFVNEEGSVIRKNHVWNNLIGDSFPADSTFPELFNLERFPEIPRLLKQSLNGEAVSYEASITGEDGTEHFFIFDHLPHLEQDDFSGVYIFGKEITEKRQAELEVAAVQADLKETLRLQQGLTVKFTKQGGEYIISLCEGSLLDRIGVSGDMIGKPVSAVLPEEKIDSITACYDEAWTGHFLQYEGKIKDVAYYMSLQPVFKNGQVSEVIGSAVNISDLYEAQEKLKKSESLYRSVLSTMSEGLAVHNSKGEILTVNEKFAAFFKRSAEEMIGQNFFQLECRLYDEKGEPRSYHKFPSYTTARTGEAIHGYVMAVEHPNHPVFWITVNAEPLIKDDALVGCVVTINDMTTQKLQEIELMKYNATMISAKEEAERANKEKSLFLSKISHELRTPLNSIMGFSHMLLDSSEALPDKNKEWLDKIHKAGQHLLYLINDITDLTKIEAGEIPLTKEHLPVYSLLNETLTMMRPIAEDASLSLFSSLNYVKEKSIYVDKARFNQIVFNLLSNAFKYNKENGTVIVFSYAEENWIHIDIMDTGIGMPPDSLDKIFEPFVRLDSSFQEGTGIGLSLVKQYTELMGGRCSVSSKEGEGTTFRVSFPAAAECKQRIV